MQLLLLLLAAGAAAVPHVGPSDEGILQYRAPQPGGYSFGYNPAHGEGGGASWRKESADAAGNVIGSYGFKDPDGRVRLVTYAANQDGFQANVQSNEPGLPQRNLGLGAGIPQWPIPRVHTHAHHAGTTKTGPHHGSWSARPPVALKHADAPVGAPYSFSYDSSAIGGPLQQEVGDALGSKRGVYGLSGQRVNYVANAGGFRTNFQSNEPGVDNTKSATGLGSSSSASSGRQEDGDNGLIFPPPYPGGPGASGSGVPGYGTNDGSGTADDDGVRTTIESNEPGFNGVQNPADVDVYQRPGLVGIALVFSGPPGSAPTGAALIPPSGVGIEGRSLPVGPTGIGFLVPPGTTGPLYRGYGQQGGSSVHNFAYGNGQVEGPWQQKYGDLAGNKEGSYGVTVNDDRFRNVNYVTGANGFSASGDANEPAGNGAQSPADVDINKSREPAATAPAGESSGADGARPPTGSGGFPGVHGHVIPAAPLRPALIGPAGVLSIPGSTGYPGVQGQAFVPFGSAGPASPVLPAVSAVPGSYGFNVIHSNPSGIGTPGLNMPVPTSNVAFPSPAFDLVGGYSFGYTGGPEGVVHREAGDTSGTRSGVYSFNGEGGAVRNFNDATDGGEFRASVQRNQHGIDTSQNLAGVSVSTPRGVALISAPVSQTPNPPFYRHHVARGGH